MSAAYDPEEASAHDELDLLVDDFRRRLEEILGNPDAEYVKVYHLCWMQLTVRSDRKISSPA